MVSTKTFVPSSSFLRHEFGQPTITVFGFMPPRPLVWILVTHKSSIRIIRHLQIEMIIFPFSFSLSLSCYFGVLDFEGERNTFGWVSLG